MKMSSLLVGAIVALMLVGAATAQVIGTGVCECALSAGDYVVNQKINTEDVNPEDPKRCIDVKAGGETVGQICWELTLDEEDEFASLDWWTVGGTFTGDVCVKGGPEKNTYSYTNSEGADGLVTPTAKEISHFLFCGTFTPDNGEECVEETAWAAGSRYTQRGNWATYTPYQTVEVVTLYAGQTIPVGTVSFSVPDGDGKVTITINLNGNVHLVDDDEPVKIQGYDSAPSGNPAPGLFTTYKGSDLEIKVPKYAFYGIHLDVEVC